MTDDPLDRLTPDLAAEVRRNLLVCLGTGLAVAALLGLAFGLAVDPSFSGVTGGVGALVFAAFVAIALPLAGLVVTLAYLFDCWPAALRRRFLRERFGVAAEDVAPPARRAVVREPAYWAAVARGAVVGWAFASGTLLAAFALTGKWSSGVPSAMPVFAGGLLAGEAWFVRRVVALASARGPGVPVPAPATVPEMQGDL